MYKVSITNLHHHYTELWFDMLDNGHIHWSRSNKWNPLPGTNFVVDNVAASAGQIWY